MLQAQATRLRFAEVAIAGSDGFTRERLFIFPQLRADVFETG